MNKEKALRDLPSVDEVVKSSQAQKWLAAYPRAYVLVAIREAIDKRRQLIAGGGAGGAKVETSLASMADEIELRAKGLSTPSLTPVINATGIVVHTNLGRAVLPEAATENMLRLAGGYSNLEYDLAEGKRGSRHSHLKRLITDITGAADGLAVNNNAGAVLICLSALAKGKEAVVSRGELVEIGGSFRIPDVMAASGAVLREVGTTNKTHLHDYEAAINENTGLILKVHRSNYTIGGFTGEVSLEDLSALGKKVRVPVMYDMGSGCLVDLKPYGIHSEPTVAEAFKAGVDLATFSGDKLLGGPQAGIVAGRETLVRAVRENPLARALRIDKHTLAALEATLLLYADPERAKAEVPVLRMLLEEPASIKKRARKIASAIEANDVQVKVAVAEDVSKAGGGALPEVDLKTFVVRLKPTAMGANRLEQLLRLGSPPVVARIKDEALVLDARTIMDSEIKTLTACLKQALTAI